MPTISVAKGLVELKTINDRIDKKIENAAFIALVRGDSKKIFNVDMTTDKADKELKSNFKSIDALISRRKRIKEAIVQSNAQTKITIGNEEYTVAEAIERKVSIKYQKKLLESMQNQLAKAEQKVENHNEDIDTDVKDLLGKMCSNPENPPNPNLLKETEKAYRETNELRLLDPLNIRTKIETMDEEIDTFLADVDVALTESNARTNIEI